MIKYRHCSIFYVDNVVAPKRKTQKNPKPMKRETFIFITQNIGCYFEFLTSFAIW